MRRRCRRRSAKPPNLTVIEGEADDLLIENGRVAGVRLADGREFRAGAVVLTTGTFLRGLIHIGEQQIAGRPGRRGAGRWAFPRRLERIGFALGRLKTGTPPRLDGRTIDWASLEMQPGDEPPEPFSTLTERIDNPQIQCGITRTTEATHAVIRANVHRSPMYSGQIQSRGPRYCPSIEDKIVRFGERDGHQIFLEPEGLDDHHGLSERHLDLAAGGRADRAAGDHSGPGTGPHGAAGLRHRIRPRRSARAAANPGNQARFRAFPGRPDQRHHRLRGGRRPGPGRRAQCGARGPARAARSFSTAPKAISA